MKGVICYRCPAPCEGLSYVGYSYPIYYSRLELWNFNLTLISLDIRDPKLSKIMRLLEMKCPGEFSLI